MMLEGSRKERKREKGLSAFIIFDWILFLLGSDGSISGHPITTNGLHMKKNIHTFALASHPIRGSVQLRNLQIVNGYSERSDLR